MKTYICLINFTEQGVRALKESPTRAGAFRASLEAAGIKVICQLWTTGPYDGLLVVQGEDEISILSQLTHLATLGNVRATSLRAFDASEFAAIVGG